MRCLVLGGRGFIGSAVVAAARRRGWDVTAAGRADAPALAGTSWDVVVHAAGNSLKFRANQDPCWDFEHSVSLVYRSLRTYRFREFALISTVDVYDPVDREAATREEAPIDLTRLCPYGFHRRLAEILAMREAERWRIFRLGMVIGDRAWKGPVHDLLTGAPLWVHPESRFTFMTWEHAGEIVTTLIAEAPANQVFNVCGRGSVRFQDVVGLLPPDHSAHWVSDPKRHVYRVSTERTEAFVDLPDSWEEVRTYLAARLLERTRRERT